MTVIRQKVSNEICKAPFIEANNKILHCITQIYSTPPLLPPKHIESNLMSAVLCPMYTAQ
jgi:hypothetical protein